MPSTFNNWGTTPAGPVGLYTLTNRQGNQVTISDYGATLTSVLISGQQMVVGFDHLAGYLSEHPFYGATIGRYGNRIAAGRFTLDGTTYQVPLNNGPNALHGGPLGFDKKIWTAEVQPTPVATRLHLTLVSPDGDMGFPGELRVSLTYEWDDNNQLGIRYLATTDRPTVVNLTNHAYFNIGGEDNVLAHELQLEADHYVAIDANGIPTGTLPEVTGTPFDFRQPTPIGTGIGSNHPQLALTNGFDHTFVLRHHSGQLRRFAELHDPASGRRLTAFTTEPGVQVFTANFAAGQFRERGGRALAPYSAVCLETQHFPDSPNQPGFPSTVLRPGERYDSTTAYRFE